MESEVEQLPQAFDAAGTNAGKSLPLPGTEAYQALPQFPKGSPLPFRRTIRRQELRQIAPWPKQRSTKWSAAASSRVAST
jgi:prophage regulatory protein